MRHHDGAGGIEHDVPIPRQLLQTLLDLGPRTLDQLGQIGHCRRPAGPGKRSVDVHTQQLEIRAGHYRLQILHGLHSGERWTLGRR
jgi:hypothetical protein